MARHGADVVFEQKLSGKDADNRQNTGVSAMQISNAKRVVGYCRNEVHSPTGVNPVNQLFAGQRGRGQNRSIANASQSCESRAEPERPLVGNDPAHRRRELQRRF
jgi:hypothetical protein